MSTVIWLLMIATYLAITVLLLSRFIRTFKSIDFRTIKFSELKPSPSMLPAMFIIQAIGVIVFACLFLFYVIYGGGLDIMSFEPAGLNESFYMLPFVFLLTVVTALLNYPEAKELKWFRGLFIITFTANTLFAIALAILVFSFLSGNW